MAKSGRDMECWIMKHENEGSTIDLRWSEWNHNRLWLITLATFVGTTATLRAQIVNGHFEDEPDLTGWTVEGPVTLGIAPPADPWPRNRLATLRETRSGGLTRIYQTPITLPDPLPAELTFRYRMIPGEETAANPTGLPRPVLLAAVSAKTHPDPPSGTGVGTQYVDVFAGDTEPRSASIGEPTTELLLELTFDMEIELMTGLPEGEVTTDSGEIDTLEVFSDAGGDDKRLRVTMTDVPHRAGVNMAFPGVVPKAIATAASEYACRDTLRVRVVTCDYNNDGRFTFSGDVTTSLNGDLTDPVHFRADRNLDGVIDTSDHTDGLAAGLLNGPWVPLHIMSNVRATPPDSFIVRLTEPSGSGADLVTYASGSGAPAFLRGFFYEDTNGELLYDASLITVSSDDVSPDGLYTVRLNLAAAGLSANQDVRLEFGLASAVNGKSTAVVLDDVSFDCPVTGFCCEDITGHLTVLNDQSGCTVDDCPNDVAQHTNTVSDCCGECNTVAADIVIMFDTTTSTSARDLQAERKAAKALLTAFSEANPRPRVAIGEFRGVCTPTPCTTFIHSGAELNGSYSMNYGDDDGVENADYTVTPSDDDDDLYDIIDHITERGGYTNIKKAIEVAQAELDTNGDPNTPNYIILLTDGKANRPTDSGHGSSGINSCNDSVCECENAREYARLAAETARAAEPRTEIFAVHFIGEPDNCSDNEDDIALDWLQNHLVDDPAHYVNAVDPESQALLLCAMLNVAELISCDDDDPTTADCCIDGACYNGAPCEQ